MTVRTNMNALFAYRNLAIHQNFASKSLRRLSSGYRINSAADDAAGLAISEKMRGQISGLKMASRNAQNAISMLQTAEGALNETHAILQRMNELAVQSANGTYDDANDRFNLEKEYQSLMDEICRIAGYTNYNGMNLLDGTLGGKSGLDNIGRVGIDAVSITGTYAGTSKLNLVANDDGSYTFILQAGRETLTQNVSGADTSATFTLADGTDIQFDFSMQNLKAGVMSNIQHDGAGGISNKVRTATLDDKPLFQIGANGTADQRSGVRIGDMSTALMGLGNLASTGLWSTSIATQSDAAAAIDVIKKAVNEVSSARGDIGAQISRLEFTISNLDNTAENLIAAESSIRDADMAAEMMNYVKHSILIQAAQAMLAQAMQEPNTILYLLNNL